MGPRLRDSCLMTPAGRRHIGLKAYFRQKKCPPFKMSLDLVNMMHKDAKNKYGNPWDWRPILQGESDLVS